MWLLYLMRFPVDPAVPWATDVAALAPIYLTSLLLYLCLHPLNPNFHNISVSQHLLSATYGWKFKCPFLDLQHQASSGYVVSSSCRLVNLSAHQHRGHADLVVVLRPAADRLGLLQQDTLAALLPADGEGVVHDEPRLAGVDVVGATNMAVGCERGLGCGGHGVLPLGAVRHDDGLEGQRVHVKPRQRFDLSAPWRSCSCGVFAAPVENAVDLPHLVQNGCYARIGVRQHRDVGAFEQTQQVWKLLLIHP